MSHGGLLSPGKGIEWGIRAVARLKDDGRRWRSHRRTTHPKVLAVEGERYRETLQRLIDDLDLTDVVTLDDRYLDERSSPSTWFEPTSSCCRTIT